MPEDQKSSWRGRLGKSASATVRIDSSFSSTELDDIRAGIEKWNEYSRSAFGHDFFQVQVASLVNSEIPQDADDCGFTGSSESEFAIIREIGTGRWAPLRMNETNPGVTVRCTADQVLVKQALFINMDYTHPSQVKSVTVHEVGHTVGLEHSCNAAGDSPDYVGCSKLSSSHSYREAVMNPFLKLKDTPLRVLNIHVPEIKEDLRSNDMERTQCLYGSRES